LEVINPSTEFGKIGVLGGKLTVKKPDLFVCIGWADSHVAKQKYEQVSNTEACFSGPKEQELFF